MIFDSNLWFSQPSIILSRADFYLGYFFAACLILAIILKVLKRFSANLVKIKLNNKFFHLFLTVGISGLVWYGFRYENTPIFAVRAWAGANLVLGVVWFLFLVNYLVFNFNSELKEYDRELLKNKYIPGSKTK